MRLPPVATTVPTARLLLRAPRPSDVPELRRLLKENAAHLRPWSPAASGDGDPHSFIALTQLVTSQRRAWRDDRSYVLLVTDITDGRLVGRVALSEITRGVFQNAYLGYWMDHRATGRGLMTEAVRAAVGFALRDLGLHRVQAAIIAENLPSLRVIAKAGFREEGVAKAYLKIAGSWQDHRIFAITAEDVSALQQQEGPISSA